MKRDVSYIETLTDNGRDYAGCKYCLTCQRSHGPLFVCSSYTGTEQIDLELAGIRRQSNKNRWDHPKIPAHISKLLVALGF